MFVIVHCDKSEKAVSVLNKRGNRKRKKEQEETETLNRMREADKARQLYLVITD